MEKHLRSRSDSCGFSSCGEICRSLWTAPQPALVPAGRGQQFLEVTNNRSWGPALHFSRFRLIIFNFLCPNKAFCVSSRASSYNSVYTLGIHKKLKEKHKQKIGLFIYDLGCYCKTSCLRLVEIHLLLPPNCLDLNYTCVLAHVYICALSAYPEPKIRRGCWSPRMEIKDHCELSWALGPNLSPLQEQ